MASIGFFSPQHEWGDGLPKICARIKEIVGPTSVGFPFACSPVQDHDGTEALSYAVLRGHVPIHIDRMNANMKSQAMFMFVLEAENRPVLLVANAVDEANKVILVPDMVKAPRMAFGAIELCAGSAIHVDITRTWHGITGFPTGDLIAELPEAVLVQIPHGRPDDIGGALFTMKRVIAHDERFADLREHL